MQRGFAIPSLTTILVVLGAVTLAASAIWGAVAWHASVNYQRGANAKQLEWDQAKLEAAEDERVRRAAVNAALEDERKKRAAAEAAAHNANRKWQEARRANRDAALGACAPAQRIEPDGPVAQDRDGRAAGGALRMPAGSADRDHPAGGGVVLHWRFVGLWDGAYTTAAGEPLFGAASEHALAPERAGAPSPYTLDDVIDVHGENARAHSDCLRKFDQVIANIERASQAFDQGRSQ